MDQHKSESQLHHSSFTEVRRRKCNMVLPSENAKIGFLSLLGSAMFLLVHICEKEMESKMEK